MMTDTRDEAVEVPLTEEQVEALNVGFGCLLPPTEIYKLGYRAAYATLTRQLAEALEGKENYHKLWDAKAAEVMQLNRQLAEAQRELEEWKRGSRAHVAAENVANERRKLAERQLAEAQGVIERQSAALRAFSDHATYPVAIEINPRGYAWREEILDYAKELADAVLDKP